MRLGAALVGSNGRLQNQPYLTPCIHSSMDLCDLRNLSGRVYELQTVYAAALPAFAKTWKVKQSSILFSRLSINPQLGFPSKS